jgi:hypothetical protein
MIPGQYISTQVRAKFPGGWNKIKVITRSEKGLNRKDASSHEIITAIADNAIHCAKKAMPEATHTYFASNAHETTTYLLEETPTWAGQNSTSSHLIQKPPSVKIVARPNHTVEPLHFEFQGTLTPASIMASLLIFG